MKPCVIITGANGNLGNVVVKKFNEAGYAVAALVSPGKAAGSELNSFASVYEADLRDELSVGNAFKKILADHPTIQAAMLLAGGFAMGNLEKTSVEDLTKMLQLNFITAYSATRAVATHMMKQPTGGRIVLVGARPGLEHRGGKDMVAYALSKSLIFKLAELVNAEGKSKNVTASVIVPGTIDTADNRKAMPSTDFSTWVTPEEIAAAMLYLVSENGKSLRETVLKIYGNG